MIQSFGPRAQAARFVVAGATVFVIQISLGLALAGPCGLPIQVAVPLAYAGAVTTHFSLQRWFVFAGARFALRPRQQILRYLPMTGTQYAFTAITTATLPAALDVSDRIVYVGATLVAAVVAFVYLRLRVFHGTLSGPQR
jgi:putative flippase GtrA